MYPLYLKIENFLSYSLPTELDFSLFDVAVLSGQNGAGKSSLLESLLWAIWGKARHQTDDTLVSFGKEFLRVEVILKDGDRELRVVRSRKKGKQGRTSLEFYSKASGDSNWIVRTGRTIRETAQIIEKELSLPYEVFVNSAFLRQGRADEFTLKTPAERKAVLSDILLLNHWEELSLGFREKYRQKINEIEALELSIANFNQDEEKEKALSLQSAALSEDHKKVELTIKECLESILPLKEKSILAERLASRRETLLEGYQKNRQKLNELLAEIEIERRELKELNQKGDRATEINRAYALWLKADLSVKEWAKKENRLRGLEQKKSLLTQKLAEEKARRDTKVLAYKNEIAKIKKELEHRLQVIFSITQCPTCFRKFGNEKEKERVAAELETEAKLKIDKIQTELTKVESKNFSDLNQKISRLESEIAAVGYDNQARKEAERISEKYLFSVSEKEELNKISAKISSKETALNRLQTESEKLKTELEKILAEGKEAGQKLEKLKPEIEKLKQKEMALEEFRNKRSRIERELAEVKALIATIREERKRLLEQKKRAQILREEASRFLELAEACGKNGVQAMIVEETLPILEEKANSLLADLSQGQMTLSFETERQRRAGEGVVETLDIHIADALGTRPYELYSGGEAFRINIAIRVALSFLLAERAGSRVEFLVIDEGFGALDLSGRDSLIRALTTIQRYFEKILIITHINELKEAFPTEIQVTKSAAGSRLDIISHRG